MNNEKLFPRANRLLDEGRKAEAEALYFEFQQRHPELAWTAEINLERCQLLKHTREDLALRHSNATTAAYDAVGVMWRDEPACNDWSGWQVNSASGRRLFASRNGRIAVRRGLRVQPNTYYRLRTKAFVSRSGANIYWLVKDSGICTGGSHFEGTLATIDRYTASRDGYLETDVVFRTNHTTFTIQLGLRTDDKNRETEFSLESCALEKLPAEDACTPVECEPEERVVASMATIPSRVEVLRDVISSLYYQVDEIRVFLNGYKTIPSFLRDDYKISCEKSSLWGDNGDAGKFFWIDDTTPGYRLICDDDIIFPPDYAVRMVAEVKEADDNAVVGVHGILLKQPVGDYYSGDYRAVTHYRSSNLTSFPCHLLGTGAVAYRAERLRADWSRFAFRNMADVWLAKICQEQRIGQLCVNRPQFWVKPQKAVERDSIYVNSSQRSATSMDTAALQTAVIHHLSPLSVLHSAERRKKIIIAIKTYNRKQYLKDCVESFLETASTDYQWCVIVADDGSTDGTQDYLLKLKLPHEFHIIWNTRRYAVGQTNTIFDKAEELGFDYGFCVDDDLVFRQPGWDSLYLQAIDRSGFDHLVHRHIYHAEQLASKQGRVVPQATRGEGRHVSLVARGGADFDLGTGSLFTFTPVTLQRIGRCDEDNFPIRGQWHVDLHIRAARAGCNRPFALYDVEGSNDCLEIQNYISEEYRAAIPWGSEYRATKEPDELRRRQSVMDDTSRVYIKAPSKRSTGSRAELKQFFDAAFVLNLDRRPDRWEAIEEKADVLGLPLTRVAAIDGKTEPSASEYSEYLQRPSWAIEQCRKINTNFQFYREHHPHGVRVEYFERRNKARAIRSPGAWGYLKSMIHVLSLAIESEYERFLVLDDDAMFHRDIATLFPAHAAQLPNDWLIFQLGAIQYHWKKEWITRYSDNLYMCHGTSLGSHAVGMTREIAPFVLNECLHFDLPYDEGPLHRAKSLWPHRCLTARPNLVIQDVGDSDISDSTTLVNGNASRFERFGWNLVDYY